MNQVRAALALLLLCSASAFAKAPAFHYLSPDSVKLQTVLPGPPIAGSPANNADIQAVLARQQSRTAFQIARARSEENLTPAAFDSVLGNGFTPRTCPLTFTLLADATSDADAISASAKKLWRRPRPPLQDHAIHPAVTLPSTPSYPSGHAMRGMLWAILLVKLDPYDTYPDAAIIARGRQIGEDRIIGGVHFPTDVAAGQKLAGVLAARLLANPHFDYDFDRAEAEFARPLHGPGMR